MLRTGLTVAVLLTITVRRSLSSSACRSARDTHQRSCAPAADCERLLAADAPRLAAAAATHREQPKRWLENNARDGYFRRHAGWAGLHGTGRSEVTYEGSAAAAAVVRDGRQQTERRHRAASSTAEQLQRPHTTRHNAHARSQSTY